jgi:hypothetical protein
LSETWLAARFPDLLRRISIEPANIPHAEWLKAITSGSRTTSPKEVLDFVRLAAGRPGDASFLVDSFRKGDATFPAESAEQLHALLAGAWLVQLMEGPTPAGRVACLGVVTMPFRGWRPVLQELVSRAEESLRNSAIAERQGPPARAALNLSALETSVKNLEQVKTQNLLGANVADPIIEAIKATHAVMGGPIKDGLGTAANLERQFRQASEELDVLWWLFGGNSRSDAEPFAKLPANKLASVAAFDLESLTQFDLPPASAAAVLGKALTAASSREISIKDFVNASDRGDRKRCHPSVESSRDVTPIATAMAKSLEVQDSSGWVAVAEALSGMDLASSHSATELAEELYRELLLLRNLKMSKG